MLRPTSALTLLAAAALLAAGARAEPQLVDSKVWGSGVSLLAPAWIDARQILFLTGPDFKVNEQRRALAIWQIDGSASVYRENINPHCYRDGVIVYKALDTADPRLIRGTWYAGPIGNERPLRKDAEGDVARLYDPLNCKVATQKELAEQGLRNRRRTVALLEKHGQLDVSVPRLSALPENGPVQFVSAAKGSAVTLPFGSLEFNPALAYYEFSGSYLVRGLYFDVEKRATVFPWPAQRERPVWMVKPDGSATRQLIPKGPWSGNDDPFPYASAAGLLLVRHGGIFDRTDGLYLVEGNVARQLLPGRVGPVGVSPDGCTIAFTHAPSTDEDNADVKNRRTLKLMRLCKGSS